jgi:hypothetical protein
MKRSCHADPHTEDYHRLMQYRDHDVRSKYFLHGYNDNNSAFPMEESNGTFI